jgi:predicted  nucleic acid-binding Zn-ribbon protein
MADTNTTITQSTRVTLGIVVSVLGGVLWLSTIYSNVIATKEEVQSIKLQIVAMQSDIRSGSERQTKLETQFSYIQQSLDEIKKGLENIKSR